MSESTARRHAAAGPAARALAGPDRSGSAARSTSTCCRPATPAARRARTSRPGWRTPRRGRHEQAWRELVADNPFPGDPRAGLLPPVRERLQPRQPRQRRLDPLGRAVPRRPRARARLGVRPAAAPAPASACSSSAPGPSGLSAAYHLARLGHEVEIRDAGDEPGGMMRYGIPAYRMPRDVLDAEIDRIAALGVRITCGHRVEDLAAERERGRLRRGLRRGRRAPLQARRHPGPRRRADRRRGVVPAQRRVRRARR